MEYVWLKETTWKKNYWSQIHFQRMFFSNFTNINFSLRCTLFKAEGGVWIAVNQTNQISPCACYCLVLLRFDWLIDWLIDRLIVGTWQTSHVNMNNYLGQVLAWLLTGYKLISYLWLTPSLRRWIRPTNHPTNRRKIGHASFISDHPSADTGAGSASSVAMKDGWPLVVVG